MLRYRGKASVCPGRVVSLNDFTTARHVRVDILYVRPSSSHSSSIRARAFAVVASPTLVVPDPVPELSPNVVFTAANDTRTLAGSLSVAVVPNVKCCASLASAPRSRARRRPLPFSSSSSSPSVRRVVLPVVRRVVAVHRRDRPRLVLLLVRARKRAHPGVYLLALARRAVVAVAVVARRAVARARRRRRQPRLRGEERESIHRSRSAVEGARFVGSRRSIVVDPRREVGRARPIDAARVARDAIDRRDRWMRDRPFCRRFMTQGYGCMGKQ